jgi:hypothetical protein
MNEQKTCTGCFKTKPLDDFHKNDTKQGRFAICKPCSNARANEWRKKNKDKIPVISRNNLLKTRYGITSSQYDEMVIKQCNKCLICGQEPTKKKAFQTWRLHIDHCHKTGKVRGLLCHLCNRGLGLFRENIDLVEKAFHYLKSH